MNLPEIYESDYLNAVLRIHKEQSPVKYDIFSVSCRTVESYKNNKKLTGDVISHDFTILDFRAQIPSLITGLRYWSLKTKIIIVPDENTTNS